MFFFKQYYLFYMDYIILFYLGGLKFIIAIKIVQLFSK